MTNINQTNIMRGWFIVFFGWLLNLDPKHYLLKAR